MTKEQEEAIKKLEYYLQNSAYKRVDSDFFENNWEIVNLEIPQAIETVLNMLKENSEEIEQKNTELAEKSAEIEKDKIIDLMVEHINYLSDELVQATGRNELEFCNGNKCCIDSDYSCEQCIKQYFKQKATNNG